MRVDSSDDSVEPGGATRSAASSAGTGPVGAEGLDISASSNPAANPVATAGLHPPALPHGGVQFGKYRILAELARGGMGIVYTARQPELDRVVCLKMLVAGPDASPEQIERLFREAQSAAKLSHPNIVPVHEFGDVDGQHYFTMEYVQGRTLASIIDHKPLAPAAAALIALRVARALQYAHEQGVIHRDIKPSNILVRTNISAGALTAEQWEQAEIKVADFGLARGVNREDKHLTMPFSVLGTPLYMSPEQARGEQDNIDAKSDVYSLGVVLYEMLTGSAPMSDLPVRQILRRLEDDNDQPPPPSAVNAKVDPLLEAICLQATRKNRFERYASAALLADDLERYLEGGEILAPRASRWRRRQWRRPLVASAAFVAVLLIAGMFAKRYLDQPRRYVPSNTNLIQWTDAAKNLGTVRTVEGTLVYADRTAHRVFFDFSSDEKNLEVICNEEDGARFPSGFERLYAGKKVWICGPIDSDNGKAQIVLRDPSQIRVIGDGDSVGVFQSPSEKNLIQWTDAIQHLGTAKTVEGMVVGTGRAAGLVFLHFAHDKTSFEVVCHRDSWPRFSEGFEQLYVGKKVWVAGNIESYQGQPEINLRDPAQIRIVGEGAAATLTPSDKNLIRWTDAAKNLGTIKTVEGTIMKTGRAAGLVFLDFSQDRTSLAVVCPIDAWGRFPAGFEQLYVGKKIWVCGTIESYQGQPEIVLRDPSQIRIVEEDAVAILTPSDKNLIQWTDAAQNLGAVKTVEGTVVGSGRTAALVFLDFKHDDKTSFQVISRREAWVRFPEGFERLYAGKKVWVCGTIDSYKGRPEIVLREPSQIKIVGEGDPPATTRETQ